MPAREGLRQLLLMALGAFDADQFCLVIKTHQFAP